MNVGEIFIETFQNIYMLQLIALVLIVGFICLTAKIFLLSKKKQKNLQTNVEMRDWFFWV